MICPSIYWMCKIYSRDWLHQVCKCITRFRLYQMMFLFGCIYSTCNMYCTYYIQCVLNIYWGIIFAFEPSIASEAFLTFLLLLFLRLILVLLCDSSDHVQRFPHQLLLHRLQAAVLLKHLAGHIERESVRVHNTLEGQKQTSQMCMYVCMYEYICVCNFICMFVCLCVCLYACMYLYMHLCMYLCMYLYMHLCMYLCMYLCLTRALIWKPWLTAGYMMWCDQWSMVSTSGHWLGFATTCDEQRQQQTVMNRQAWPVR